MFYGKKLLAIAGGFDSKANRPNQPPTATLLEHTCLGAEAPLRMRLKRTPASAMTYLRAPRLPTCMRLNVCQASRQDAACTPQRLKSHCTRVARPALLAARAGTKNPERVDHQTSNIRTFRLQNKTDTIFCSISQALSSEVGGCGEIRDALCA